MENIVEIRANKVFLYNEASRLLPLIFRLSEKASLDVKLLSNRLEAFADKGHPKVLLIEEEISSVYVQWQLKMTKLGVQPKGMWIVDFDCGDGYFCWKFPEIKINYRHGYQDGFSGRILIE